jgi:hypothetical protein
MGEPAYHTPSHEKGLLNPSDYSWSEETLDEVRKTHSHRELNRGHSVPQPPSLATWLLRLSLQNNQTNDYYKLYC